MALSASGVEIVGRDEEIATIRDILGSVEGLPTAILIEGPAGIGKTMVWHAGLATAEECGYRLLSARPVEAETEVSYAGLADLLQPVLDETLPMLPRPQRRALEAALLRRDPPAAVGPDRGAVAFAFLGVLLAVAEEKPTLVAVDDLPWLDAPSVFALRFAARRLREAHVALLLTARSDASEVARDFGRSFQPEHLRRIEVGPLDLGGVQYLLHNRLGLTLSRPALRRINETAKGNPFFALELAHALKERGDELEPGEPLPVGPGLRHVLSDRLAALPKQSAEALLFASAVSHPTIPLLSTAVEKDVGPSLAHAADLGIVELHGDRVRFSHPLFASALYSGIGKARRQRIHRRLAEIVADAEERARQLALSTDLGDADVAVALDLGASIARRRGAPQTAAELYEKALRLTPPRDLEAAHRRRLEAAAAHFEAGDSPRAQGLLDEAVKTAPDRARRAEAMSRLARVHHYAGNQRLAVRLFEECLTDREADISVEIDAAEGLATALFFLREQLDEALRHATFAVRKAEEEGNPAALAVALGTRGVIEAVLGRRGATATLESAASYQRHAHELPLVRQPRFQLAFSRVWHDGLEGARAGLTLIRDEAFVQGDESSLPFVLTYLSLADHLAGRWDDALRAANEGVDIALAADQGIGLAFALSARALVESCLGREEAARADVEEALALAERGTMLATTTSRWAIALLELSLGDPRGAREALAGLAEHYEAAGIREPGAARFLSDEIEALVALGEEHEARARLERLERDARRLRRGSALAAVHRCRGLIALASGAADESLAELELSLQGFERVAQPFERARTLLALGVAQRKAKRRRAARETLEQALAAFDQLGAVLWSQRTQTELRRISGRAPKLDELTETERRVADLVAAGRTNREVAAELFLSPRTVEGHLSRIYAKFGVRSRTELARALPSSK